MAWSPQSQSSGGFSEYYRAIIGELSRDSRDLSRDNRDLSCDK